MASLLAKFNVGTTSVSSLVKSAQTLQNDTANFNDDEAKLTYEYSNKEPSDYQTYLNYLQGRISSLNSSGTVTDQTKALTLTGDMYSAQSTYDSAEIGRDSDAIMQGTATDQDKYNLIVSLFTQAGATGDSDLQQSLQDKADSLSQTIQLDAVKASTAASSLSSSESTSISSSVTSSVDTLKQQLDAVNFEYSNSGSKDIAKQSAAFAKSMNLNVKGGAATIISSAAGVIGMVKPGVQLTDTSKFSQGTYNPGSILDMYTQAIALDPTKASTYEADISDIIQNQSTYKVGGVDMTYSSLMNSVYAGNGNSPTQPYTEVHEEDGSFKLVANDVTGYVIGKDQNGQPKTMVAYSFFGGTSNATAKALVAAGFNAKSDSNNLFYVQGTSKTSWFTSVAGNDPVVVVQQKNGSFQFLDKSGNLMQLVNDGQKYGVQSIGNNGKVSNPNVRGQYVFNPKTAGGLKPNVTQKFNNSIKPKGGLPQKGTNLDYKMTATKSGGKGLNLVSLAGKAVDDILGMGTASADQIVATSQFLARANAAHEAMIQATAAPIKTSSTPIAVAPVPNLSIAPPKPTPQLKVSNPLGGLGNTTTNPQGGNVNPQGGTVNPQGNNAGAGINQSGTGGIKLTPSATSGIKL
jgi:hypothetical protein